MVNQRTCTQTPIMRWLLPDSDHDCLWHHADSPTPDGEPGQLLHQHQRHHWVIRTQQKPHRHQLQFRSLQARSHCPSPAKNHQHSRQRPHHTSWSTTKQHGTGTTARSSNSCTVRNSRTRNIRTTKTQVQPAGNTKLCTLANKRASIARALHDSTTTGYNTCRVSKHDLPGLRTRLQC